MEFHALCLFSFILGWSWMIGCEGGIVGIVDMRCIETPHNYRPLRQSWRDHKHYQDANWIMLQQYEVKNEVERARRGQAIRKMAMGGGNSP